MQTPAFFPENKKRSIDRWQKATHMTTGSGTKTAWHVHWKRFHKRIESSDL